MKFHKRAFISLITFFLSIMALITGVVLLTMPDATMAYWNKWTFLFLQKNEWEQFHAVVCIYLSIIVIFHIIQNWKAMLGYMKNKVKENFKYKKELITACVVSITVIFGSAVETPLTVVMKPFEPVQNVWYTQEYEPPFEDAQGLSLTLLAKAEEFNVTKIKKAFEKNSIKFNSYEATLEEIAEQNNQSSRDLYLLIHSN